ncbi:MAG: conjugal transfer/entry exclusion protein [Bacteroidia bacterium]|jgi:conjugal transfer/entry exclusion protein
MKNIVLTVCAAVLIQVSTCGNQGSYSSSTKGRSFSTIDQLYKEYSDKHEKIESINDTYSSLVNGQGKALAEWNQYNQFSIAYWSEVKQFIGNFDTTTQQNLSQFFDKQEVNYKKSTKGFKKEGAAMTDNWDALDKKMKMLKLLASHHQLEAFLNDKKPDIKVLEDYNSELKKLDNEVIKANDNLTKDPSLVRNLK